MKKNRTPTGKKYILQILSIIAAITLWFAIIYTDDPSLTVSINNIPLKTTGENLLGENNLIFADRSKLPAISIEVRGRRSNVKSILNSVTAQIDLSDISRAGEYSREITFNIPNSSVMLTKKKISSLDIKVEKSISKEVPVYINQTGTNKTNLVKSTPQNNQVSITGTSDDISKIKEAIISVDIEKMQAANAGEYPVTLGDSAHNAVTPENPVNISMQTINVENIPYLKKTVDIALNPELDISGYQVFVKSFSKTKIEVGVASEQFNKISVIYADFANPITKNLNGKYTMKLIIPEGVYCPSSNEELIMNADIEAITTEPVTVSIIPENQPAGTSTRFETSSVTVHMTGAKSKFSDVKAKVDLSGLGRGTHTVPVVFITENTGITVTSKPTVNVTIE